MDMGHRIFANGKYNMTSDAILLAGEVLIFFWQLLSIFIHLLNVYVFQAVLL